MTPDTDKESWKQSLKDPAILWAGISFLVLFASYIWQWIDPENYDAPTATFCAWLSSLMAIGYLSTPSGSWYGKAAFAGVCVMVLGIGFKILHLPASNVLIVIGLAIITFSYLLPRIKNKKLKNP
jgi:hypothetical protein